MSDLSPAELAVLEQLRRVPENEEPLGHPVFDRRRTATHSDLFAELQRAVAGLPHLEWYAPKAVYFRADTAMIFAGAAGMEIISVRLPTERVAEAMAEGASVTANPGWVTFAPFATDGFDRAGCPRGPLAIPIDTMRERLRRWCIVAHAAAGPASSSH